MQTDTEQNSSAVVRGANTNNPISAIVADNAAAQARFLAMVSCLSGRQVTEMAGDRGVDGSTLVCRWTHAQQILALRVNGDLLYPAFQLHEGKSHPVIARVLAVLGRRSAWQAVF
jgi:hypothetical protein